MWTKILTAVLTICLSYHCARAQQSIDDSIAQQKKRQQDISQSLSDTISKLQNTGTLQQSAAPRVYLYVKINTQAAAIDTIRNNVEKISIGQEKVVVPNFYFQDMTTATDQLRYFRIEDRATGDLIVSQLKNLIPDLKLFDFTSDSGALKVKNIYYELWLKPSTTTKIAETH